MRACRPDTRRKKAELRRLPQPVGAALLCKGADLTRSGTACAGERVPRFRPSLSVNYSGSDCPVSQIVIL